MKARSATRSWDGLWPARARHQMQAQQAAYEAALAEERRIRQENEQKQAAEMAQMYNYIQSLLSKWVITSQPSL